MPSPSRADADSTGRLSRWGLGILASLIVFMALPAVGWAMFASQSKNGASSITAAADWTPPAVTLTDPGDAIRGTTTISATATDGETGIRNVAIAWAPGDTSTWTTVCVATAMPYACAFNTTALPEDDVDLLATATDNAGYTATSLVEGVLIDNTAPSGALDSIGNPLSGVVNIGATAADTGAGVASVVVQRAISGTTNWTTICTDADAPYTCRFDTTAVPSGTSLDFRAVVADAAGNATTTTTVKNRLVNNLVSSVSVDDPGAFLRGTVTLTANANAALGVASVRLQRQASGSTTWVDVCTDTASPYSCSWDTATVTDGDYRFRAILTDTLGATTTSAVVGPAQVDNTPVRASDVQATSGGSAGKLSAGDTITFTYSRPMKPASLLPGWDGAARSIVVRLRDGLTLGLTTSDDTIDVFTSAAYTTPVNLGAVDLKGNYVKNNKVVSFNATLSQSGATVTLTLGSALSGASQLRKVSETLNMVWTPSALAIDTTNIACSPAPVTETGTKDRDF